MLKLFINSKWHTSTYASTDRRLKRTKWMKEPKYTIIWVFLNIIAELQFKEKGLTLSQFLINLLSSSMDVLSLSRSFK